MRRDELTGTVFNIQHYCIHDGPGIRTGVFVKGCPLRCLWCANPESQSTHPQIFWEEHKCTRCQACVAACPRKALSFSENKICIDLAMCDGCGQCAQICPSGARTIAGKTMTCSQVMEEVLEDRLFYGADGGITVSGGEPTMQPDFTRALLAASKEAGITTAIETCGYTSQETLAAIAPLCDTFLYDVKAVNPQKHRACTLRYNQPILANLSMLAASFPQCDIWIRTPIIPGYNDSEEDMERLRDLAASVPTCSQVHLLPYHNLGEGKREQLGDPAAFTAEIPSAEHMERLRDIIRESGKPVY